MFFFLFYVNFLKFHDLLRLGLLFFINWFTDFFTENLGTEGEIKIKIKYVTSTLHFIKMVCNIL